MDFIIIDQELRNQINYVLKRKRETLRGMQDRALNRGFEDSPPIHRSFNQSTAR